MNISVRAFPAFENVFQTRVSRILHRQVPLLYLPNHLIPNWKNYLVKKMFNWFLQRNLWTSQFSFKQLCNIIFQGIVFHVKKWSPEKFWREENCLIVFKVAQIEGTFKEPWR